MPNQPSRLARPKGRTEPASPAVDEPPPPTKRNRRSEQTKARKQNRKCDGPADHLLTRARELQDAFAQGTSGDEAVEIWMVHAAAGHRDRLKESCLTKAPVRHLPGRLEGVFGPHGAHFEEAACRLRFCKGNPLTIRNFLILADEAGKWISALERDHLAELERIGMDCRALSEPDDGAKWIWTLFEVAWLRVGDDEPLDRDFLRADRWVWSNEFNTQSRYVPGSSEQLWANVDAVEASIPRIRQELKQLGEQPAKIDEMERQTATAAWDEYIGVFVHNTGIKLPGGFSTLKKKSRVAKASGTAGKIKDQLRRWYRDARNHLFDTGELLPPPSLAILAHACGISEPTVSRWLRGKVGSPDLVLVHLWKGVRDEEYVRKPLAI